MKPVLEVEEAELATPPSAESVDELYEQIHCILDRDESGKALTACEAFAIKKGYSFWRFCDDTAQLTELLQIVLKAEAAGIEAEKRRLQEAKQETKPLDW